MPVDSVLLPDKFHLCELILGLWPIVQSKPFFHFYLNFVDYPRYNEYLSSERCSFWKRTDITDVNLEEGLYKAYFYELEAFARIYKLFSASLDCRASDQVSLNTMPSLLVW